MGLDKDKAVNTKTYPLTVKCRSGMSHTTSSAGKMGKGVPDSTVEFFDDIRKPLIRSSPLGTLEHCPRKFLYEYRLGIKTRRYESALLMGTIVHKVLESLFTGETPTEALSVCERLLAKEQARLVEDAGTDGFLSTGEALDPVMKKLEEDYHKARATGLVFWQFVPFNQDEWEVLRTPDNEPMIEVIMECEYPGLNRPIRCPCDLALLHKPTGEVWIVDYKTTTFDPKKRAIPTQISAQLKLYRLVLQTHLDSWAEAGLAPKRKVAGSMHAIIKKPGIKSGTAKDKKNAEEWGCGLFEAYIRRLVQWYKDADASDPENPPLILDPNRFTGPLMTQELWGRLKQYCKACNAQPNIHHFYRAGESACMQYNRICPFMKLCKSCPSMWPDLVEQGFRISFREDDEDAGTD